MSNKQRIIVGISGASGFCLATHFIDNLSNYPVEIHLVLSKAAQITRQHESTLTLSDLKTKVAYYHPINDIGACIASGSFSHQGMIIMPCSMNTVAEIAHGLSSNLLTRAADVCLKEKRKLIVVPRETPLHQMHLKNLTAIAELGGLIVPPIPAFYHQPQSMQDMMQQFSGKILSLLGFEQTLNPEWQGWC